MDTTYKLKQDEKAPKSQKSEIDPRTSGRPVTLNGLEELDIRPGVVATLPPPSSPTSATMITSGGDGYARAILETRRVSRRERMTP